MIILNFYHNMEKNKKINISLNVIKCLAIFAVVCIHCPFFPLETKKYLITDAFARFAVPFFFLVSGYYSFFNNHETALNKYKFRIVKLIKLYVCSILLYLVFFYIANNIKDVHSIFNISNLYSFVVFNITPFGIHLWFIGALIYCYAIYYVVNKFNFNNKILYIFIPILLLSCLIIGEFSQYFGIVYPVEYYRNFLFLAMPFFILGYLLHDKKELIINTLSTKLLIILVIFGFLLTFFEALVVGKLDLYVGSIIVSLSIFIWCVKNPNKLNFKISSFIGGKLFTSIYVLHVLVLSVIPLNYGILNPFILFGITTLISYITTISQN